MKNLVLFLLVFAACSIFAQNEIRFEKVKQIEIKQMFPDEKKDNMSNLEFSPDGKMLFLTVGSNNYLIDIPTCKIKQKVYCDYTNASSASFSPDGKEIAFSTWDTKGVKTVYWEQGSKKARAYKTKQTSAKFDYSPDGKYLAIADNGILLFDREKEKQVALIGDKKKLYHSLAFSNDGKYIAGSATFKTLIYEVESMNKVAEIIDKKGDLLFLKNGYLAILSNKGGVTIWDPANGAQKGEVDNYYKRSSDRGLAFSPDGKFLFVGSIYEADGYSKTPKMVYNAETYKFIKSEIDKISGIPKHIAVHPMGKYVAFVTSTPNEFHLYYLADD